MARLVPPKKDLFKPAFPNEGSMETWPWDDLQDAGLMPLVLWFSRKQSLRQSLNVLIEVQPQGSQGEEKWKQGRKGGKPIEKCSIIELATASPDTRLLAQSCEMFLAGHKEHNWFKAVSSSERRRERILSVGSFYLLSQDWGLSPRALIPLHFQVVSLGLFGQLLGKLS